MIFLKRMAISVQFDGKPFPARRKIEDERANRNLPCELPAFEPMTAQDSPKGAFGRGHVAAELLCSLCRNLIPLLAHFPLSLTLSPAGRGNKVNRSAAP